MNKFFDRPDILEYLFEKKIKSLTEIQEKSAPVLLASQSIFASAPTGSGKTLAFALPIITKFKNDEKKLVNRKGPYALVLAPTRELANQISKVFKEVAHHAKLKVRLISGGDQGKSARDLKRDIPDIVIAVPGRALSAFKRKELDLSSLHFLVMDEADQLLDLGFSKDLEAIYTTLEKENLTLALFSATMPERLIEFKEKLFKETSFFELLLGRDSKLTPRVETFNISLRDEEKPSMVEAFIKKEGKGRGIIFLNRKEDAAKLYESIKERLRFVNFSLLHGEVEGIARKKAYHEFKENGGILICTDIAARGIDIDGLSWVLNYDLPFSAVYYIHRAGRTARMGKSGRVFNFMTPKDDNIIKRINEAIIGQHSLSIDAIKWVIKKDKGEKKAVKKRDERKKNSIKRSPRYARKK